jgi:hypothetical protein
MRIDINERFSIEADDYNVTLLEKQISEKKNSKSLGEIMEYPRGYYCTFQQAFDAMIDYEVKTSDLKSLNAIISAINSLKDDIAEALDHLGYDKKRFKVSSGD